ncbi:MAG: group II intron reverse transcriptase/maturase [Methylococcaceae bacterium]
MVSLIDVLSETTLYCAWIKVYENQGCAGIDGISLDDFSEGLWNKLEILANEVRNNTYRPKPLLSVEIDKPSGGIRTLAIPVIRDRILQTAVTMVLTPLFEAEFEDISFAYRKGRSVNQAVARIELLRNQGYQWVVDADIKTFFDQVDHQLLMQQIEKFVIDKDILRLIRLWLKATVVKGKQRYQLKIGLAQGSPISPLLANLFLDQLDETLLDKKYKIIRYADDFVILCKSEKRAKQALQLSGEVLEQLRLCFNQSKTEITHFNRGFRFLGVDFIRSLVFKSQYPKTSITVDSSQKTTRLNKPSQIEKESNALLTEMQQAFLLAGITPGQFVPQRIASSPTPSESAEPESLEIQSIDETAVSSYDPRLKTLYLLKHGSVLGKESERFVIRYKGTIQQEIPSIHVDQIMVFGNVQITTQVMQFSLQKRIPIFLLSGKGRFYGVVDSFDTESVMLHQQQFLQAANSQFCLKLSIAIVQGKLTNSRVILRRFKRHHDATELTTAAKQLSSIIKQLHNADDLDQLRGYEGSAARIYFQAFSAVLDPHWQFYKRTKQPPTDPVNAMLSYGYTLLFYNVYSLLRTRGLNPHIGSLHPIRQGHPALVSDMMEEFRSIIVDSVVFNIAINNKLKPDDFTLPEQSGEACLLSKDARKFFITQLEKKFNARLQHPVSGLNLDYRRCIEHQVNHLVAVVRQSTPDYLPMVLR